MVDIAMCGRRDCPRRRTCFRYIAEPDTYQTYIVIEDDVGEKCDMYWQCRNSKELKFMNRVNR